MRVCDRCGKEVSYDDCVTVIGMDLGQEMLVCSHECFVALCKNSEFKKLFKEARK